MPTLHKFDYESLFTALPESYVVFLPDDPDFTIIAENKAHAAIANVTHKEVIGRPLFDVWPDVSEKYQQTGVSDLVESLRNVIRTGQPDTMPLLHYDIPGQDGTFEQRYWRVTHYPVKDAQGEVAAVFQATEDITQEMNTGTKLEQVEQQLEEALSSGLMGTWLWDVPADTVIGDRYMAEMFGVPPQEAAVGLPLERFVTSIHPEDRERLRAEINISLESGDVFNTEYRTLRPDNSIRWVIARGRVKRNEKGEAVQFPGVLLDITDRKNIESNLAFLNKAGAILSTSLDYKKTLQTICELAVPSIADWCTVQIADSKGLLQQVALAHKDPAKVKWALELNKKQGAPHVDEPGGVGEVMRTGHAGLYPDISDELLAASAKSEEELRLLREVGMSSVIIVPLTIDGKAIGGISLISAEQKRHYTTSDLDMAMSLASRASIAIANAQLFDAAQKEISSRKKLEEQLRIANEELERRVDERTAQLEETNLNLERSNRELQDFAYVASHDLQEPLRKIQAFGNLLEEEYAEKLGEGRDYLERMRGAAKRMSLLIEDILSFSRVTTKARGFTSVDLTVVTREVVEDLEMRIKDSGAEVIFSELPTIDADAMQIRQLLQNLIANALKFHKPDVAPVVKITAEVDISQPGRKKTCTIIVNDNGVGFDEKYLDRIFAVFQRLHNRDSYEGTGIGLAVCRKIVERHGGTITARSKPNHGASFIVTLPVHHKKGEKL